MVLPLRPGAGAEEQKGEYDEYIFIHNAQLTAMCRFYCEKCDFMCNFDTNSCITIYYDFTQDMGTQRGMVGEW